MKHNNHIFTLLLAAAAFYSCTKAVDLDESVPGEGVTSITASFAESGTRTVLDDNGTSILWSPSDAIKVFYGKSSAKFTSTNTEPSDVAIFTSYSTLMFGSCEGSDRYIYAAYPYAGSSSDGSSVTVTVKTSQTSAEGSFASGMFPAVGRSKTVSMPFYNVCGGLCFSLTQDNVQSVTFSGNCGECLAGAARVQFDEDGIPYVEEITDGESTVTINAPTSSGFEPGTLYYMSLLPCRLEKGFTMRFTKTGPSLEAVLKTDADITVKRSIFGSLKNADKGLKYGDVTDLSSSGTANSYIVNAAGNYMFNASVKGGSTEPLDGTAASAKVLWESFGTDKSPSVGDIITAASYSGGYVKFSTPAELNNGNALIAVEDASGNILWSWHIWVCKDFDPEATAQVYNNNAGTVMDRNLGATSATPGDVHALGLMYQWGRKDPFMSGSEVAYSGNQTTAASTGNWPSYTKSDYSTGTTAYAVANPMTFIAYNLYNSDWYYTGSSDTDNTRWQTSDKDKGLYDPCPSGWRVPDGGDRGLWALAFGTGSEWVGADNWDAVNMGMNYGTTDKTLGSCSTIWYPAAGYYSRNYGHIDGVGRNGRYWSCTPLGNEVEYFAFGSSGKTKPSSEPSVRAMARSVRCMKDGTAPAVVHSGSVKYSDGQPAVGVSVSDGFNVVTTDGNGNFDLPENVPDSRYIYISYPSDAKITTSSGCPQFFKSRLGGNSCEFTLERQAVENEFSLFALADPQAHYEVRSNQKTPDTERFATESVQAINSQIAAQGIPCYGVTLGDIVYSEGSRNSNPGMSVMRDNFASINMPVFQTMGNHDYTYFYTGNPLTTDSGSSTLYLKAQRSFEDCFGPVNFSFNRGNVHIVCMRDIIYDSTTDASDYHGGFTDDQYKWLEADLANVSKDKMVILCVHKPICSISDDGNVAKAISLLNQYKNSTVFSGHTHHYRGYSNVGGSSIFEHVHSAVCGQWWWSRMEGDGCPNGYTIYKIKDNEIKDAYFIGVNDKMNTRNYQMRIYRGNTLNGGPYAYFQWPHSENTYLINVFSGDSRWTVKVYEDGQFCGNAELMASSKKTYESVSYGTTYTVPEASSQDWWSIGYHIGVCGRGTASTSYYTSNFHMWKYVANSAASKIKVEATDPYGNVYSCEDIIENSSTAYTYPDYVREPLAD